MIDVKDSEYTIIRPSSCIFVVKRVTISVIIFQADKLAPNDAGPSAAMVVTEPNGEYYHLWRELKLLTLLTSCSLDGDDELVGGRKKSLWQWLKILKVDPSLPCCYGNCQDLVAWI